MNSITEIYIGEYGPRGKTLDDLRTWLEEDQIEEKVKPVRGAYSIWKTCSIEYLSENCFFNVAKIKWDENESPEEVIDRLADNFLEDYRNLSIKIEALYGKKNKEIIDPYDKIKKKIQKIKSMSDLSAKCIQLTSMMDVFNKFSNVYKILLINSCRSKDINEKFRGFFNSLMDNNIKIVFEKYEWDKDLPGFKCGKLKKNHSETVFLEAPNYDNIKDFIKKGLGKVDADCIINYAGCHPAFVVSICLKIDRDEEIDLNILSKKAKNIRAKLRFHLNCYFKILKENEPVLYSEYLNHFFDVSKIKDEYMDDMIMWGLCYKKLKRCVKTPILYKKHVIEEVKLGNIDHRFKGHQLNIIENIDDLEQFEELVLKPSTLEKEIHNYIKDNPWILGPEFRVLSSNQTLDNVIEELHGTKSMGTGSRERPDLLLREETCDKIILIEFKRPSYCLAWEDEAQIKKYRDKIKYKLPYKEIQMILIGGRVRPEMNLQKVENDIRFLTYQEILINVRNHL